MFHVKHCDECYRMIFSISSETSLVGNISREILIYFSLGNISGEIINLI